MIRAIRLLFILVPAAAISLASPADDHADGGVPLAGSGIVELSADSTRDMIDRWQNALLVDERILEEISGFAEEPGEFSAGYAERLAVDLRRLVFERASQQLELALTDGCTPFIDVTYEEPGFANDSGPVTDREKEFEEGFIRTEVLACLEADDSTAESVLRRYTDPEFRMEVSSRIKRIWVEGEESCIETKGLRPFLSSTLACNRIDELISPGLASQHSQVVSNPGGDDYQDVYFKESLKTFVNVPGGVVFHYINYTRAVKLGGLRKRIGRGKVKGSQEKAVRELQSVLSGVPAD